MDLNSFTSVPVVDLRLSEQAAAAVVRDACTTFGFFYVENHGVPDGLIKQHFNLQAKFFAQPLEAKLEIAADENNRGYTPLFDETLDPDHSSAPDTHEGLYFGREVPSDHEDAKLPLHGPNQWPSEANLPGYKEVITAYMEAVTALGFKLLRIIALSLDLSADHFHSAFLKPMTFLRPLRYTADVSQAEEGKYAAGAHTDYGFLTLLKTDGVPGLQIYINGNWMDVPPRGSAFIVNLGDMLERWTNGMYKSTLHRVINTKGVIRHSCAFFFEPSIDTVVEVLPQCCKDEPPKYTPVTSGQHLLERYAATHAGYGEIMKQGGAKCTLDA